MKLWIDAQLSPSLGPWLSEQFDIDVVAVGTIGLRDAKDRDIFFAARKEGAAILTKDADFVTLLEKHGAPPAILWLTSGNTTNARVRDLLASAWPRILAHLDAGEILIELQNVV